MFAGDEALRWVKNELRSQGAATLAVAFWGAGAAEALGLDRNVAGREVHIICNLAMGGTNPIEIEKLQALSGVRVSQCDNLHAKIYMFADAAMVGSSNVSANGLSFEGPMAVSWREANLVTYDQETRDKLATFIDDLETRSITKLDLDRARAAWQARESVARETMQKVSIVEFLDREPEAFEGAQLYLTLTSGDRSDEADEAVDKMREDYPSADAWEDWEKLPSPGTFVSFEEGKRGVRFDALYARIENFPDRPESKGRSSLQWCFPIKKSIGLLSPRSPREKAHWTNLFELVTAKHRHPVDGDPAICITFEELARLWPRSKRQ